ncbi:MAG: UDP-N-acetylmuramate--L-alanine ligase [Defluviitaleaceae bacterium]|nr:UDP-N-acetylmuramate--L-alanine ligase [Defluviitaleaceae bacterium]
MEYGDRLKNCTKAHFIGVGGISMSGLACTLHSKGVTVTGSDAKHSDTLDTLESAGVEVFVGHHADNVPEDADLVVYTAAVKRDNPEFVRAEALGLHILDRAALIGLMMDGYSRPICVSGTHGKTTTTSMISQILLTSGKNPTLNIGGVLPSINSNYLVGGDEYFVVESCEYFDGFLNFKPHIGVVLNIETDHLDYFKDLAHIEGSFGSFVGNIRESGALVVNEETSSCANITNRARCRVVGYGGPNSLFRAADVAYSSEGMASFDLLIDGKFADRISLRLRGAHNVSNALAAIAACWVERIPLEQIKSGLESFTGSKRRYEYKGTLHGVTIIDDYAHHPTEIKATLAGARNSRYGKLVCVFQPHTYTRTKKLLAELGTSFGDADVVVLVDIYSAREKDTGEIHSRDLAGQISANGRETHYMPSFEAAETFLRQKCVHGDLLITMGAGDVHKLAEHLLSTKLST